MIPGIFSTTIYVMQTKFFFFVILLLLLSFVSVFPQDENPFGVILYAEGNDFSLYRNGEYVTKNIRRDGVFGMPLFQDDMIQTSENTYLEIQLYPTKSIVKVAENTTFTVEGLAGGETRFNLTYGRIRAKVQRLTGRGQFEIRGKEAVAGVRGTDFGVDVVMELESSEEIPKETVYCFEGSVEVRLKDEEPTVIEQNEMVFLEPKAEEKREPEKTAVTQKIITFWSVNDFKEQPVEPENLDQKFPGLFKKVEEITGRPVVTERKGEPIQVPEKEPIEEKEPPKETQRVKFFLKDYQALSFGYGLFAGGILLEGAGFALAYAGEGIWSWLDIPQNRTLGHAFMISGGVITVTGVAAIVIGYLLK